MSYSKEIGQYLAGVLQGLVESENKAAKEGLGGLLPKKRH